MESNSEWREIFEKIGVMRSGHFVMNSDLHSDSYIDKDALFVRSIMLWNFAHHILMNFLIGLPSVHLVVGPESGGAKLAGTLSFWLDAYTPDEDVYCAYPEKRDGKYVFKRGQGERLRDKRVLVVDDVLTTGDTLVKVKDAVERHGGIVANFFVVWDRRRIQTDTLCGVPLQASFGMDISSWEANSCPLCARGVPIDEEFV